MIQILNYFIQCIFNWWIIVKYEKFSSNNGYLGKNFHLDSVEDFLSDILTRSENPPQTQIHDQNGGEATENSHQPHWLDSHWPLTNCNYYWKSHKIFQRCPTRKIKISLKSVKDGDFIQSINIGLRFRGPGHIRPLLFKSYLIIFYKFLDLITLGRSSLFSTSSQLNP